MIRSWVPLLVTAAGCASAGGMTTARTLQAGADQWMVAPELNPTPEIGVGYRRGVGAEIEVAAKVSTLPAGEALTSLGAELSARRQIWTSGRLELAAGVAAGYRLIHSSGATWEAGYGELPVLVGINVRRGLDQLVIGPRVGYQRWYSSGSMPVDLPYWGASIGYAWAATRSLTVFPELALTRSTTLVQSRDRHRMVRFGVGFLFK
jgi:hypothetical protein